MKKLLTAITIIIVLSCHSLFAEMIHIGSSNTTPPPVRQELIGYIDSVTLLEVSPPIYSGNGFNLDIMDANNELRFQISPTMVALSVPGAKIGSFSMITNNLGSKLRITHTPLTTTVVETVDDVEVLTTVLLDWELGVSWDWNGIPQEMMCLSAGWSMGGNVSEVNRSIVILLNVTQQGQYVVRIHDAGLLFRLSSEYPVKKQGVYSATVIFEVEGS